MATGGLDFGSNSKEEKFTCPVCLEIFECPISIPCGHTFCIDCLYSSENASGKSRCPVCRTYFQPHQKSKARFIEQQIFQSISTCPGCYRQFPMSRLRAHRAACPQMSADLSFSPIASTRQSFPEAKNRSTFACPYCNTRNMDCKSLLQHVNNYHKGETQSVVCPICASMPWGNPNQSSANFVEHINLRHKFEYDTFVDYENEEDTVLKQVLAKSMQEW